MNQTVSERKARNVLDPRSKQAAVNTPTFVRGEGSWLIDEAGKRYLDLSAGLVAVNMGHTHPKITAAIAEQAQKVAYVPPSLVNDVRCELADLLSELSPWDEGARTFFRSEERRVGKECRSRRWPRQGNERTERKDTYSRYRREKHI